MKIIAGVETPDSGELTIGERAFARLNPALAHQLGIYLVPQEPMLFPNLSACTWPAPSVKSMPLSTATPENCLQIWRASSSGFIIAPRLNK
jgi:ABC-type polar amino acid transport system ATPase subunit